MASIINANTSGGLISTGDTSGQLQLQTAGTTALTISSAQVVSLTNALPVASGGTGSSTLAGANIATTNSSTQSITSINTFGFKNRIINGGMVIDQRNAGASYTNSNAAVYGLDRWRSYGLSGCVLTIQQSTTAPTGFSNSQSVTITTSTTANDIGGLNQIIEGNNVFDLNWGTSSGVAITASFWVRASIIGTYNIFIRFYGSTASYYYIATYTVNVANTWEFKTINISAPPVGAGAFTAALNSSYIEFRPVISSSGYTTTVTANTWSTSSTSKTSGSVDLASNSGATFYITGVQVEVGTQATSFDFRDYGRELILCQRYYQTLGYQLVGRVESTSIVTMVATLQVAMRTSPTSTVIGTPNVVVPGVGAATVTGIASNTPSTNGMYISFYASGLIAGSVVLGSPPIIIGTSAEL
jgi:hypothetical protein